MTILWDRGNIHDRSKVVRAYLAEHPEIVTEEFPGYAPEANPDEGVWGHTKYGRLANFAPEDTAELRAVLVEEFERLHRRARAAGVVHPARRGPDPVTVLVPLATLESVELSDGSADGPPDSGEMMPRPIAGWAAVIPRTRGHHGGG